MNHEPVPSFHHRTFWKTFGGMFNAKRAASWAALVVVWCASVFPGISHAADKAPTTVDVGMFLNSIPYVNLKERKFQADFNLWFRWTGDNINALEGFSVVDGFVDSKEELVKKTVGEAHYGLYRIVATIHRNFDLSRYPLDDHDLKIQIEDLKRNSAEMVYRADSANTNMSDRVHVPGWDSRHFEAGTSLSRYQTNYGDAAHAKDKESSYSRFTFSLEMRRNGYGNFFKLFAMLFFGGILSFFAFRVRSENLDARLALIMSGIFMAAITASMISSTLPESDSLDMAEKLYFATMGFIFAACFGSLYTQKLHVSGREDKAGRISHVLGLALPVAYVIVTVLIVALAHSEL
jgi:hypothetical protein